MLTRLSVSNFAIIDELQMQFQKGLTIITGETGAGKSILLGALKLILGERADLKQLNDSTKKCIIEAQFSISNLQLQAFFEENELDYDAETILRRELLPSGKSRAFINDTPVTLNILQELGEKLIDIHSQFNTENIFHQDFQLQILDAFASQMNLIRKYQTEFLKRNQILIRLKSKREELDQLSREADYKQFLLDELLATNLVRNEFEELEKEQIELQNVDEIQRVLVEISTKLDTAEFGILSQLHEASNQLQKLAGMGEELENYQKRLESSRIELDDLNTEIAQKTQRLESNPERLFEVNERLDLIQNLLHKHRVSSIEELLSIQFELENENQNFQNLEAEISKLENDLHQIENQLGSLSDEISIARKSSIPKVEKEILESLGKLGMENSTMKLELSQKKDFQWNGKDEIEFLFSANKGAEMKQVSKSVSGGERSRLMLSVKKALAGKLELPTLILDEIDTGVSGKVANEVGNLMKEMADSLQLISITHLPQVAAKANQHFKISKNIKNGKTITQVHELSNENRVREIAELLSGSDITEKAIDQAKELIKA
ncbi:DNA repair protein RecN [Moheibacter lacus]|uniref:DNA repair protein RecN n=1 Tax=Moheibacter lacus TaxID=2745851 RepID=A0A838ZT05_9FLAO|nr:DNA repair protein RecN [Moheibacter lacus]MBA5630102.1 DNA repair protein RecN [Moheibacter lacus]